MTKFDDTACMCEDCGGLIGTRPHVVGDSVRRTPWAVRCVRHGLVFLTSHEYRAQMLQADALWTCPICQGRAEWDDNNWDEYMEWLERKEPK